MRRICALTERRADYSKLRPVLQKIKEDPSFELLLIVTGHHLLHSMGHSVELIEADGFNIARQIPMFSEKADDNGANMVKAMGRALIGITEALEEIHPDIMLIGFDLGAHLAAAIAAAHMNIPVAHIEGGEVTGSIDESLRHATTKFAHLHFTSSMLSAERLIKMGENPKYVFNVGCPSLDTLLNMDFIHPEELAKKFGLDLSRPLILVLQHPVTSEDDESAKQIGETLKAVKKTGMQCILVYPNIDAGGKRIINTIQGSGIPSYPNLPFETYASLMKIASVIVGNSSSGIVEAPSLHRPAVNIGTRQQGRLKTANVIDVGYNANEIYQAITKAVYDKNFRKSLDNLFNPYGDGKASSRVVEILKSIDLNNPELLQKKLTY